PKDEDVVIELDGDDWLTKNTVLKILNNVYTDPNIWLTYGSWIKHLSGVRDKLGAPIPTNYAYSKGPWIFSQLRTSKFFLWKNLREKDLIQPSTKRYYMRACDQAYFRPLAQMAGRQHAKWIEEILYTYNTDPKRIQFLYGNDPIDSSHKELMRRTWQYKEMTKAELLKNNYLKGFKFLM
ncbi:MAG: hypothetical protein IMZ47_06040, partial [Firmicutes bacterium]|nr:hypothetical protein [Bacillota bacterium]